MTNDRDDDEAGGWLPGRRSFLVGATLITTGGTLAARQIFGGASGERSSRQELVVAFDGTATTRFAFDPHNSGFAPYNRVIRSIFDNLTVLHPDQTVGPWLAESWDLSADGTTYQFKLRKGVRFHDGTPFDAAALKANFDRLANPEPKPLYSRSSIGPYLGSEIIAPDTLRVILSEPFTPLLRNLSSTKLGLVSPAAVAKYGPGFAQNPVGTGPFRFVGLTTATDIRLERNPEYQWAPATSSHSGPAHLETLTFRTSQSRQPQCHADRNTNDEANQRARVPPPLPNALIAPCPAFIEGPCKSPADHEDAQRTDCC